MAARKKPTWPFPDTKISETFLDFAAPLLAVADEEATKDQVEDVLKIAFTVWNSVVFDTVNGNARYVTWIRNAYAGNPFLAAWVEQLISRKQALFVDDLRLVGHYRIIQKEGEWRLWAEARAPRTTC